MASRGLSDRALSAMEPSRLLAEEYTAKALD
jgi:hypothetical protein